jgi:glucose/arabinose dehydrogenase
MKSRNRLVIIFLICLIAALVVWFFNKVNKSVTQNPITVPATQVADKQVPELEATVIADGLKNVWDIGFTPTGTVLFTERAGEISKLVDGQKQSLLKVPGVYVRGEGGLLGMTVDPDFTQSRYIFVCYNTSRDIRVSRFTLNEAESALTNQKDIVTGLPTNTSTYPGRHSGCRPRFGPDNNLWVGTGDVAIGSNPQSPASLGGKIVRVDREGKGVSGNLPAPFDNRIFSYGHRNVQGLAMFGAVKNGQYGFSVEHGTGVDDEVNKLVSGNFGYDPVPGYNERVPMTDTDKFPDAITAVWSSGPTIAPSGATIISGNNWGAYEGLLAVAILKGKELRLFEINADNAVTKETSLLKDTYGRLRSVNMGPDNSMYLTTDNGTNDQIIKVSPK